MITLQAKSGPKLIFYFFCSYVIKICFFITGVNSTNDMKTDLLNYDLGHFPNRQSDTGLSCLFITFLRCDLSLNSHIAIHIWQTYAGGSHYAWTISILKVWMKSVSMKPFMLRSHQSWPRLRIHTHFRTKSSIRCSTKIHNLSLSPHTHSHYHLLMNPLVSTAHQLINETVNADFAGLHVLHSPCERPTKNKSDLSNKLIIIEPYGSQCVHNLSLSVLSYLEQGTCNRKTEILHFRCLSFTILIIQAGLNMPVELTQRKRSI